MAKRGTPTTLASPDTLFAASAALLGEVEKSPPRMDVKFPVLGFLMEAEMTGYDLKRLFRNSVGFFYRASDGSLYPALRKLLTDGLVRMRTERRGRRTRKVYSITPLGRERFLRMLTEPSPPVFVHDEAMVKVYFAHHNPRAALEHIARMRKRDETWAGALAVIVDELARRGENPFRRALVELGREITRTRFATLARIEERLRRQLAPAQPARGRAARLRAAGGRR
jgi:DNA-binding PadR family transcriptional regulator